MESKGKVRRLLFLTVILTMLMAGCTYAASLSSRTYTLSPQGYIAWSDFSVPSSETVTINISSSTVNRAGLTLKTLNALKYEILNLSNGTVAGTYTRFGAQRYVQVKSSRYQVYDRISVTLPAGNYRFRVTDTEAVRQPLLVSYAVTDNRAEAGPAYILSSEITVTAGKTVLVPTRNNQGALVKVSAAKSSNKKIAKVSVSGTNLSVTGVSAGTCSISVTYQKKVRTFKVTVQTGKPEFQAYIKNISKSRKYMYVRIHNAGNKTISFYSAYAAEYTVNKSDNNSAASEKIAKLKMVGRKRIDIQPGKWATVKLMRRSGLFPSQNLFAKEVRLRFRYEGVKYTAAIEDSWLDGQYHLRKVTAPWYPAYPARNNFRAA